MSTVTPVRHGEPFTRADLDEMPDDGHRYELIDGALIVTPAPSRRHQRAAFELAVLLREHCPPDLEVLMAPFDVSLSRTTVLQPDILVARDEDFTDKDLPAPPVLAVEVLSPSTRHIDLMLKRARFEQAGCRSYWVVDPLAPSITAWDLRDGKYEEIGAASDDAVFEAVLPFAVSVRPNALVKR